MRKQLQKHMVKVLFAVLMLTGMTSWGQILTENFASASTGNSTTTGGSGTAWGGNTNFPSGGNASVFQAGGSVRIGSSGGSGRITSKALDLSQSGGNFTVSFDVKGWSSVEGDIKVTVTGLTAQTVTYTSTLTQSFQNKVLNFTGGASNSTVRIETTAGRAFIDNVVVQVAAPAVPILAISGTPVDHGASCVGVARPSVQYTITNTGAAASGITVVSSNEAEFVVSGLSATSLATGASATYNVTFTPSATGARSATITVASATSGSNSPTSSLTGTGNTVVASSVATNTANPVGATSATLNGNVTLGTCTTLPTSKGFFYSLTSVNANPQNGGAGVTPVSVGSSVAAGAYSQSVSGLTPNTGYSYTAYILEGTNYTYGATQTFTTSNPTATISGTLSETSLTSFTVTLAGETFVASGSFTGNDFQLNNAPSGVAIASVSRVSDTQATVALTYNNTDFDSNVTNFSITIPASHLVGGSPITSGTQTITAVVESLSVTSPVGNVAFSNVCVNQESVTSFTLSGTVKAGNIGIAAATGFTYSLTSNGTFTPTLSFATGTALSQVVYVKFSPTLNQSYSDVIGISGGSAPSITKNVTGSVVNTAPSINTPASPAYAATTATLGGTISSIGCSSVTKRGIFYSTNSNFANGTGTEVSETGTFGTGAFTVNVTSLTAGTTYYYKAFATNAGGTVYTSQGTFTTDTAPVTLPYTQNFEGTVNDFYFYTYEFSGTTNKWVINSATSNPASGKSMYITSSSGSTPPPNTYTNSETETSAFLTVDLTTAPAATLTFDWKAQGRAGEDYGRVYVNKEDGSYVAVSGELSAGGFSTWNTVQIDLTPYVGTVIDLEFYWYNSPSTQQQPPLAIDNISIVPTGKPVLTTAVESFTYNSATAAGNVTNAGGSTVTERGIVYATTANPTTANTKITAGSGAGAFTAEMTGLADNTTYYVRAYAINSSGIGYGNEIVFTSAAVNAPVATAATYSDIAGTGFIANWNTSLLATEYFLDVATTSDFGGTMLSEDFSGITTTSSVQLFALDPPRTHLAGWTGVQMYEESGTLKMGSSANAGIITTPVIDLSVNGGNSTLTFDITRYAANEDTTLRVYMATNGNAGTPTYTQIGSDIVVGDGTVTHSVNITGGSSTSKIRIASITTTSNDFRFYIDNIKVAYNTNITGYNNQSMGTATSATLTGLTAGNTYYYRVRAKGPNSTSASSNVITAVARLTNVWNGTVWTGGHVPTTVEKAVITGDYDTETDGELAAGYLTVQNNAVFTINDGDDVTVTNEVVLNNSLHTIAEGEEDLYNGNVGQQVVTGPRLIIEDNANLLQTNDVNNTGYVEVIKESAPMFRLDYALWSSPVAGETLEDFSPKTVSNRFYLYNPVSDAYGSVPGTTVFDEGRSYLIRVNNNHPAYDETTNYIGTPYVGTYIGTPNNGNVSVTNTAGYNAVGNPYPSPINIAAFYSANSGNLGSDGVLYFWRKKNGSSYSSYASLTLDGYVANGQTIATPGGNINYGDASEGQFANAAQSSTWVLNPGQGFIVETNGNPIVFNNTMRRADNNGQLFSTPSETASRVWLNLADATNSFSQAMVSYSSNGTLGLDYGRDGKALTDGAMAIYSLSGASKLGIQARPVFDATDVVPMGYKAAAGTFTIAIDHNEGVFNDGQDVFLRDNLLGTTHNLSEGAYQFVTEAGTFEGRFDVIYAAPLSTENPALDANSVIAYKNGNAISISSGTAVMNGVTVYDMRGRLLYDAKGINATETTVTGLQAQQQVLIVKVATERGEVTKKIIF